jgi:CBS-domain-containing membrane protein
MYLHPPVISATLVVITTSILIDKLEAPQWPHETTSIISKGHTSHPSSPQKAHRNSYSTRLTA